ncbi:MAG: pyrroline-5-carboxylate reductase [Bacteroidota bacterium]
MKTKVAVIGAGNLGQAIAEGIVAKGLRSSDEILLTRRSKASMQHLVDRGYKVSDDNVAAASEAGFIFLCVQPKQLEGVLWEIKPHLSEGQVLVSVITGISTDKIYEGVSRDIAVIRAMPNTAIAIGESMTCIAGNGVASHLLEEVKEMFESLGQVLIIEERLMKAATVLGASGIAFFMRYLRAATQGGIEMGFHPEEAQKIAVQTAKGAARLILENKNHPEVEIDRVTTPQGCTIAGLNEMEHQGLSSALIKGLLTSFEKINSISS